eukprot:TRINITY_DN3675_c0_g2_i2.p1 TRINITY_DN3675_c0_g2~~TRINITY_DN3675_c0_g2_i2.p1  ORF type:complete len:683 (-),score=132.80 TRINITY_DN3675_c0_g2_i2:46-2094(-)
MTNSFLTQLSTLARCLPVDHVARLRVATAARLPLVAKPPPCISCSPFSTLSRGPSPSFRPLPSRISSRTYPLLRPCISVLPRTALYSTEGPLAVSGNTLRRVLNQDQEKLLKDETALLEDIKADLIRAEVSPEDLQVLRAAIDQLSELFMLVIVGEFNSGKSSFLNAMLGEKYLKEGVVPTTSRINLLKYGGTQSHIVSPDGLMETVTIPVEWLKDLTLVDTPGTNAVIRSHQKITEHFIPRSDLVLFVTSVDRAFSESEREFLELIKVWGKKVIVVLSKIDLLESDKDREEIYNFVQGNFVSLFGIEPTIFGVSSKKALKAKQARGHQGEGSPGAALWKESAFGDLERYILQTLDSGQRAKLKLSNPLGVAEHIVTKYHASVEARFEVLAGDAAALEDMERQLAAFRTEMLRDFHTSSLRIENCLLRLGERAESFFEDRLRLGNIFQLFRPEQLRADFAKDVIGDASRDIERHVGDIVDWLLDKNHKQFRSVFEHLNKRPNMSSDKIIGRIDPMAEFAVNRSGLLASIGNSSTELVGSMDRSKENMRLLEEMRGAFVQTAAVEVGAVGLGVILSSVLLDFTGILGAGVLAVTGLGILPYKRSALKKEMRTKIAELRRNLATTLESHFTRELDNSIQRMKDTVSPYTLFVRTETDKLGALRTKLAGYKGRLAALRTDVDSRF